MMTYPLTQNYYVQKMIINYYFLCKNRNFTRNYLKMSFFSGDIENAESIKNSEK